LIVIIDYGMGNLKSVYNAFKKYTENVLISSEKKEIENAEKLVLPGVGAFGDAINNLKNYRLFEIIREKVIQDKAKFLGICLGLQLIFEESEESPGVKGFSFIEGKVKKFSLDFLKVPQIGWNSIRKVKEHKVLDGIKSGEYFYFVHSYYVDPLDNNIILTKTNYGIDYVSSIAMDNIVAFQFHPEKSHNSGLKIIENFIKW